MNCFCKTNSFATIYSWNVNFNRGNRKALRVGELLFILFMKKLLFVLCLSSGAIFSTVSSARAQFSVGVTGGLFNQGVTFDGARVSNNLWGVNIAGKYGISDNKMRVGLNIGYFFDSESEDGYTSTVFTQPITGLFEYSFMDSKFSPYAGIDAGIYRIGSRISGDGESLSGSESDFGIAPTVGFNYEISDKIDLNTSVKYNYILTENYATTGINFNAGVVIKF